MIVDAKVLIISRNTGQIILAASMRPKTSLLTDHKAEAIPRLFTITREHLSYTGISGCLTLQRLVGQHLTDLGYSSPVSAYRARK